MNIEKLSRREREIMEIIYRLRRASCSEVREKLHLPPSYSAVRAMVTKLKDRGYLSFKQEGKKYVYSPTTPKSRVKTSALRRLVTNFFEGSVGGAIVALLNEGRGDLDPEQLEEIENILERRKRENGN